MTNDANISTQARTPTTVLSGSKPILLIYSLAFAVLICGANLARHDSPILSTIGFVFIVPGFIFFVFHLFANRLRLEITDQGLTISQFFHARSIRWADIKDIRVGWTAAFDSISLPFNKRLFVHYRSSARDRSLTIWPVHFGISAGNMVQRMLPYCAQYPKLVETLIADSKDGVTL
jgi:Bacterial PH domain